jgi:DNA-directed RNA polymerase alpha subunit
MSLYETLEELLDIHSLEDIVRTAKSIQAHRNRIAARKPRWKQVLDLRESGKSFAEIAEICGIKEASARTSYHRALFDLNYTPLSTEEHHIAMLELSARCYNCLSRAGLRSVEKVVEVVKNGEKIKGMSDKLTRELVSRLRENHYLQF